MSECILTVQIQPLRVSARDDANRKTIVRKARVRLERVAPDPTVRLLVATSTASTTPRKFILARNIRSVFAKFIEEGKATIELLAPAVHLIFSLPPADPNAGDEEELRLRHSAIASLRRLVDVARQLKRDPGLEAKVNVDISPGAVADEEADEAAAAADSYLDDAAASDRSAHRAYADAVAGHHHTQHR